MDSRDEFGDRMKAYEATESLRALDPALPVYIRLDGRSFSKFTAGLPRPYDPKISFIMKEVTAELVRQFKFDVAYTQSDEISLGWFANIATEAELFFGGRIQKIITVLAGVASAKFNQLCLRLGDPYKAKALAQCPSFDARIFQVPTETELFNAFYWRNLDCQKNAVSMAARAHFSHRSLQLKNQAAMKKMMADEGINYDTHYPSFFRNGIAVKRVLRELPMPDTVPEQYRTSETVLRSRIVRTFPFFKPNLPVTQLLWKGLQ